MKLTVDGVDLNDPVSRVEAQGGDHGHPDQPIDQPSLHQRPGHGQQRGPHHRVPDRGAKILSLKL